MILDCHIHMGGNDRRGFRKLLDEAGIGGGILLSDAPACFAGSVAEKGDAKKRMRRAIEMTKGDPNLYPFFWIDPLEDGAAEQVDQAAEAGLAGFKVICGRHYPQDDRAMKIWELIAKKDKPVLFHSGILYDFGPSGDFNRPCNYEHLMFIGGLRFAMAHVSWPWCDEMIAVFGKWNFLTQGTKHVTSELYIDTTPGTPANYRAEVIKRLLTVGYPSLPDHIIFGTDCNSDYNTGMSESIVSRDSFIFDSLDTPAGFREKYFYANLLKFIGKDIPIQTGKL